LNGGRWCIHGFPGCHDRDLKTQPATSSCRSINDLIFVHVVYACLPRTQVRHAEAIARLRNSTPLSPRFWQLHAVIRRLSIKTQNNIIRVVRGEFLTTTKREIPFADKLRTRMRESVRPVMSSPDITCHGVIDLAHHRIPGLRNIDVTFIHPLWGWIQAVSCSYS